jgi:hypothetical protein
MLTLSAERSDALEQFAANPSAHFSGEYKPAVKPPSKPTQRDHLMALAAAAKVAKAVTSRQFGTACDALGSTAVLLRERAYGVPCPKSLRSLALSSLNGDSELGLEIIESHPGWQKLVAATTELGSHQLVLIVQLVAPGNETARPRWLVTNFYDRSDGALDLTWRPHRP